MFDGIPEVSGAPGGTPTWRSMVSMAATPGCGFRTAAGSPPPAPGPAPGSGRCRCRRIRRDQGGAGRDEDLDPGGLDPQVEAAHQRRVRRAGAGDAHRHHPDHFQGEGLGLQVEGPGLGPDVQDVVGRVPVALGVLDDEELVAVLQVDPPPGPRDLGGDGGVGQVQRVGLPSRPGPRWRPAAGSSSRRGGSSAAGSPGERGQQRRVGGVAQRQVGGARESTRSPASPPG